MAESDEKHSVHLRDDEVVLYKRPGGNRWQARYKLSDGKWHRISTKTANLDRAKSMATEAYDRSRFLQKEGMPEVTRRFDSVAKLAINDMQEALDKGRGKKTYVTYIQVINRYLIPFFGKRYIDKIGYEDFEQFDEWRIKLLGHEPKASTITNHVSALNRIYEVAVARGWVAKNQIPELKNRGGKSLRRPDFTPQEWLNIRIWLKDFKEIGHTEKTRQMRELLRDYVLFLANTGIRHGTESINLKWKHIEWYQHSDGERYLRLTVSGKTGRREPIARHLVEDVLQRIQARFPKLAEHTFDDLLSRQIDEYVFRLRDGTHSTNLQQTFRQFLTHYGLLKDKLGKQNRSLYSLRHMYATLALLKDGISIHDLATQMGTSVQMIEKHYSHLTPSMKAEVLSGKRFNEAATKAKLIEWVLKAKP
jgi:integrase